MRVISQTSKTAVCLLLATSVSFNGYAASKVIDKATEDVTLQAGDDLHITSADGAIASGVKINLADDDCRLYFDNVRPTDVIDKYLKAITVNGQSITQEGNAKIGVYLHGTEILPHSSDYAPLVAYSQAISKVTANPTYRDIFIRSDRLRTSRRKTRKPLFLMTRCSRLNSNGVIWSLSPLIPTVRDIAAVS